MSDEMPHDETPERDSDRADEQPASRQRNPRATPQGWRAPTPARVIELRIAHVARAIVDGLGRAAIMQATAKAQADEAAKRDKARRAARTAGADADDAEREARQLVPVVWGDNAPAQRTVDLYIRRAKDAIAEEGKKVTRQREYVLGMQLARCNDVYQAAFKAGRYQACVQVIREVNEMFGMHEAIKVLLLGASDDVQRDAQQLDLKSDEGKARALKRLVERATTADPSLGKVFARFAALPAGSLDASAIAFDADELQPPPPKDANGNGNGSNGHHS